MRDGASDKRTKRVPQRSARRFGWTARAVVLALLGVGAAGTYYALDDKAIAYSSVESHFKYGSTGAEREFGIPYAVWKALPELFPEYLPGDGYKSLGFIYEGDRDLPVGVSERSVHGIRRVGLNCGACHVGLVRESKESNPRVIVGMPANTLDLGAFQNFLFQCATDSRFTPDEIIAQIDRMNLPLGPIERLRLRYYELYRLREMLLMLRDRMQFAEVQPPFGPGRVDLATSTKSFLGMDMGRPYKRPVGTVEMSSVWQLGAREQMFLNWDGGSGSANERVWLAALHTGAVDDAADLRAIQRTREWLNDEKPPDFPMRAAPDPGFERGRVIYQNRCAECHGASGRDFTGARVGQVTELDVIRTDPNGTRTITPDLAARMNSFRVGNGPSLRKFRKPQPEGYANVPLDGIWLRAPYLHNGSVPTLRDLLEPARKRPRVFYRGSTQFDDRRVGWIYEQPQDNGRPLFAYFTGLAGNSNEGHEGTPFGTDLPPQDKDALVEFLKSF